MSVIFLSAAIMTTSAAIGAALSLSLKRRREQTRLLCELMNDLSVMIRFRAERLYAILGELCGRECYKGCVFLQRLREKMSEEDDIREAWRSAAEEAAFLTDECRSLLLSLSASLGGTDIEGQLSVIGTHRAAMERCFASADEEYKRKGRLITNVCPLLGIGVLIIMLQ